MSGSGIMHDCGPEGEIAETERLAAEQDGHNELDELNVDRDWNSRLPEDDYLDNSSTSEPVAPRDHERHILDGTYTEADAEAVKLDTLPHEFIQLAILPEDQPKIKHATHTQDTREHLYYNRDEGDALEVITVPVNKYGDTARPSDTTVAFKITFRQDDSISQSPEVAAIIVSPRSIEQMELLHEIAWGLASGRGKTAADSRQMVETLSKIASEMGVSTRDLMPAFPLNTDSGFERVMMRAR